MLDSWNREVVTKFTARYRDSIPTTDTVFPIATLNTYTGVFFFSLFFANPSDCRWKAVLCSWSKCQVGVSSSAAAGRCLLWAVCSVLGWVACCSRAGGCGCVSAASPLVACKDSVQAGFVGSVGTSQWVAMQKVVLSSKRGELLQVYLCCSQTLTNLGETVPVFQLGTLSHPSDLPVLIWDLMTCHRITVYPLERLLA